MIHIKDILDDQTIKILRDLEILNESHLCRLMVAEEFHKGLLEGRSWDEEMELLGNKVWDIAGVNYCFAPGTIKKMFIWYNKKLNDGIM